jgi:hypothetical protein
MIKISRYILHPINYIKLTNTRKVLVEKLDVSMNHLESDELIVLLIHANAEIQGSVTFVNQFGFRFIFQHIAHLVHKIKKNTFGLRARICVTASLDNLFFSV